MRNSFQIINCEVALAAFDAPDIGSVQPGTVG